MNDLSPEQQIEEAAKTNFNEIPIRIKLSNTRKRLEKILDKFFPERGKIYITNVKK